VKNVGWVEDIPNTPVKHERSKLRGRILRQAIRSNHPSTTEKALMYFSLMRNGKHLDISLDTYETVYVAGVMNGKEDEYEFVLDKYLASTFAPEQQILLRALASTPIPYLQQRTLTLALSDKVRSQDTVSVISNVAVLTPVGHVSVWLFFMSNWNEIFKENKFGRFGKMTGSITELICSYS
jgi:aminopeptidase 2